MSGKKTGNTYCAKCSVALSLEQSTEGVDRRYLCSCHLCGDSNEVSSVGGGGAGVISVAVIFVVTQTRLVVWGGAGVISVAVISVVTQTRLVVWGGGGGGGGRRYLCSCYLCGDSNEVSSVKIHCKNTLG